jgi:hypothetical protein
LVDAMADTFAIDGRLVRTLPALMFRPGHMTRKYLSGQRARYMPPFRLFLLASIVFFLTLFTAGDNLGWFQDWKISPGSVGDMVAIAEGEEVKIITLHPIAEIEADLAVPGLSEEDRAELLEDMANAAAYGDAPRVFDAEGNFNREALRALIEGNMDSDATEVERNAAYTGLERVARVYENQGKMGALARDWIPRFSVLFAPLFALSLTILYFWHRKKFVYDHLITALHYQSFLYIFGAALIAGVVFLPGLATIWVIVGVSMPIIYLYRLIRETYATNRFMTIQRMIGLFFSTGATSILLLVGLLMTLMYLA